MLHTNVSVIYFNYSCIDASIKIFNKLLDDNTFYIQVRFYSFNLNFLTWKLASSGKYMGGDKYYKEGWFITRYVILAPLKLYKIIK